MKNKVGFLFLFIVILMSCNEKEDVPVVPEPELQIEIKISYSVEPDGIEYQGVGISLCDTSMKRIISQIPVYPITSMVLKGEYVEKWVGKKVVLCYDFCQNTNNSTIGVSNLMVIESLKTYQEVKIEVCPLKKKIKIY